MPKITVARAYANNEVAYVAWDVDAKIPGCLGFEVTRIYLKPDDTEDSRVRCAAWVPFKGQRNRYWLPQDTGIWPVQKLSWRDLTLRKRRNKLERRPDEVRVAYELRPVGDWHAGLDRAPDPVPRTVRVAQRDANDQVVLDHGKRIMIDAPAYEGAPRQLGYLAAPTRTTPITITRRRGIFQSTFTNGILAAQWLSNVLLEDGKVEPDELMKMISTEGDPHREYLAGDVLPLIHEILQRDGQFFLALYELDDAELIQLLIKNHSRVHVILANSSKEGGVWDARNSKARQQLIDAHLAELHHRMFNNTHIGHNKFLVHVPPGGAPRSVLTGSTNWTSTGLAGQTNNALFVENDDLASVYLDYWTDLREDAFPMPEKFGDSGDSRAVQGQHLRELNTKSETIAIGSGANIVSWFSPNTRATAKGTKVPVDLSEVYAKMQHARQAILFLAFYPGQSGRDCIVGKAIEFGQFNHRLLVLGAVSSPEAMPNYVPRNTKTGAPAKSPFTFIDGNVSIVRAARIDDRSLANDFQIEKLVASPKGIGAIIHDKIVVIDPMSSSCSVVLGSHNLGFKASYENDENFIIVSGDKPLAQAYAVHVLDVVDHYRYRAIVAQRKADQKPRTEGFLDTTDAWMDPYLARDKGLEMRYFAHARLV